VDGQFYEAFTRQRHLWNTLTISSLETPNVREGRRVIPGLATREWVNARRDEYGEDSPLWYVRVLGEFPGQGDDTVIPLIYVEEALERWERASSEDATGTPWHIGVDVARFGDDDSVAQPRRGNVALKPREVNGFDTLQVAGMVRDMLTGAESIRGTHEPAVVNIDMGGNFGGGVLDTLLAWNNEHHLGDFVSINGVNPSSSADDPDRFPAMREQLWWELRDWLKNGGAIPPHPKLEAELVAPVYKTDSKGRPKLEPKESTKKRLSPRRSPDRADALCLAVHEVESVSMAEICNTTPTERQAVAALKSWGLNPKHHVANASSRWAGCDGKGF
jgi:hypothetical protein